MLLMTGLRHGCSLTHPKVLSNPFLIPAGSDFAELRNVKNTQPPAAPTGTNIVSLQQDRKPVVEFWYEFASTYSYLSAMRIETLASDYGVAIAWKPFLLGPIFKKQGWPTSPFNLYPTKGRYMWRDMERLCERYGLPLTMPMPFPQDSLLAARIAHAGQNQPWIGAFTRAVYIAEFGQGLNIAEESLMAELLLETGAPARQALETAHSRETKISLRADVTEAEKLGIFGAPSFVLPDGELYWGDDRLEQALEVAGNMVATDV
ncbi:2-hydroxychromene-2-carboxylate isomerase, putative [Stappia aggregata IAM 12614]|uniref:2-hydroxychromene-2-carboxylate isomerase, putative n=1 Tax=Roseibium aggregatum (strain ATCC 25650 / DSM 13394 / JCM 20685 / NBRC 16684 / NCIMB 2208 / IAM 12614 / B1) TaxID=384765 RepID=A0NZR7_ROSAI|nr:2-hydroxychromene-2-carboxylate isomerase, putative [Stappia aggregata IAM 12614] [Roseibium aggregatum IAM 12614]